MNSNKPLPATAEGLIEELDAAFPPRCILPGESPEGAHRYAGKRELIDHLKELKERDDRIALRNRIKTP